MSEHNEQNKSEPSDVGESASESEGQRRTKAWVEATSIAGAHVESDTDDLSETNGEGRTQESNVETSAAGPHVESNTGNAGFNPGADSGVSHNAAPHPPHNPQADHERRPQQPMMNPPVTLTRDQRARRLAAEYDGIARREREKHEEMARLEREKFARK